jgi:hypothetical protein
MRRSSCLLKKDFIKPPRGRLPRPQRCPLDHAEALERAQNGTNPLAEVIREYFHVCQNMNDHILLIYQETQSLPAKWRKVVLENEIRITGLFSAVLQQLTGNGQLKLMEDRKLDLMAHNITVLGHMWTFRRWFLSRHYTIDQYIDMQTEFILGQHHGVENAKALA